MTAGGVDELTTWEYLKHRNKAPSDMGQEATNNGVGYEGGIEE